MILSILLSLVVKLFLKETLTTKGSATPCSIMKILHITPSYYPATYWGGPIFSVFGLNNALARIPGVELRILTTDAAGGDRREQLDIKRLDLSVYPQQDIIFRRRLIGSSVSPGLLSELIPLIRWADVVHLTATYSFPTLPTLVICRLWKKPLVWSTRGAILSDINGQAVRKRHLKRLWQISCNSLIRIGHVYLHVTSEVESHASRARLPKAKTVIIPNGVNIPSPSTDRQSRRDSGLHILYLGRLAPVKAIDNLLDAMKWLQPTGYNVQLDICGAGTQRYTNFLKSKARTLGLLDDAVHFSGQVDDEEKENAFRRADICIIPSHSENFCMVAAEALAHDIPIIASQGTPWQRVEEMECGLWVKNNPQDLAVAIQRIGSMNLEEMGKRGRRWMQNEYSWDKIAAEMHQLYSGIL